MAPARVLQVYLDGTPIGVVAQSPHGALRFDYDDSYAQDAQATPLSLSMPLAAQRHGNKPVRAFLDGLLPDSHEARERWARQYGVSPNNSFSLLTHVGRDAAGAVQLLAPDIEPSDAATRTGDVEWLSDDDFAHMVRDLAARGAEWDPGRYGGRWSLAGAQPKMALFRDPDTGTWAIPRDSTPTTHIVKPGVRGFAGHHLNETLCLTAARHAGLPSARVELVDVDDVQAVISHRYDRRLIDGRWVRIHQEDLCQAMAVHPSLKYQSDGGPGVGEVGDLFARLPVDDRLLTAERFFKALAFNVLIGGTDAHAKNYSLVLIGPRAQLAPLYDVASAAPYPQHRRLSTAMKVGKHWTMLDVGQSDWQAAGRRLGLPAAQAVAWVEELRASLPRAFASAVESLPHGTRGEAQPLASRIVEHVERRWQPDLDRNPARHL